MAKCTIYVRNENDPASYYRILQYLPELNCEYKVRSMFTNIEHKHNMTIKNPVIKKLYQLLLLVKTYYRAISYLRTDIAEKVDCVYIERTIIPRVCFSRVDKLLSRLLNMSKLIWDFDDNIIVSGEISSVTAKLLENKATHIIVTHDYLKQTLSEQYHDKVLLLPTTDKHIPELFNEMKTKKRLEMYDKTIFVIWVGTSWSLQYLKKVIPHLETAARKLQNYGKKMELIVVCNEPLSVDCKALCINNIKWTRECAVEEIYRAHIGIMPLDDNEYTRGKGAFKLLQYMAAGLPVVASPVGFNIEVLSDCRGCLADSQDEWVEAILKLSTDRNAWGKQSEAGRDRFIKDFNPAKNIEVLNEIINKTTMNV